jgi:hypothetical protein
VPRRYSSARVLFQPPACPLLYIDSMFDEGRLILGIGFPKIEELGEDFGKASFEDLPQRCFRPVLDEDVKSHFAQLGKLL